MKLNLKKISAQDARIIRAQLDRIERTLSRIEALAKFQIESTPLALPPPARDDEPRFKQ